MKAVPVVNVSTVIKRKPQPGAGTIAGVAVVVLIMTFIDGGKLSDSEPNVEMLLAKAESGDPEAQAELGKMYFNGTGVPKDEVEAVKWYRKAAEQGDSSAQFCLGVVFLHNAELKDYVTSYAWTDIAAANGYANAKKNKPIIAKEMTPEQIAKAKELGKEMVIKNPKLINKP